MNNKLIFTTLTIILQTTIILIILSIVFYELQYATEYFLILTYIFYLGELIYLFVILNILQ